MDKLHQSSFRFVLSSVGDFFKKVFKVILSNKKALFGALIFLFFILVAIFGPIILPYDQTTDALNDFLPPSWEHPLGTDDAGRDLLRRLIDGTGDVLTIALLTSLFAVIFGTTMGLVSGFVGGTVDKIIQLITNLFLSIPSLPMLLTLSAFLSINDPFSFALILAMFNWAGLCRAVRSQIMSLKERDFIQICNVMNVPKWKIIFSELFPNISSYILVNFILIIRNAITGSVGIMMLGLASFQPSNWGAMLMRAKDVMTAPQSIYFLLAPIVCILFIQIASILLANGLDEALNPKLKRN